MSLRARLSVLMVVVAIVALAAANGFVYVVVSDHLEERLDQQVRGLAGTPAVRAALDGSGAPTQPAARSSARLGVTGSGAWVEVRDRSGSRLSGSYLLGDGDARTAPVFPAAPDLRRAKFFDGRLETEDGSIPYRGLVVSLESGRQVITALPATEVRETKQQLVLVEAGASLAVLIVTLALAWLLVGFGLRPLRRIEATAERIAAGGLSDRVEPADARTEIGRLGLALNTMLDRIERAFSAREQSERRLRSFVADASHDLRTPLTSISGYAEMLARPGVTPEERVGAVRRIREEAARLGTLVRDLLLLTRLDESAVLDARETDVAQLVGDLVADARAAAPDRSLRLTAEGPVVAEVDPDYFARAVTNLLANANHHTPPGAPVDVTVEGRDGQIVVAVADHGPGINPDLAPRIFDRFQRGDPSRSSTTGGSGLGLAIVASVAAAHGGRCDLTETNGGGGATFTLVVPAKRPATPA